MSKYHIDIICCINDIPKTTNWDGQGKTKLFGDQHLDFVTQFIVLYNSIKQNWRFPYTIYLCHSLPLSNNTRFRLENLDIVIRKISSPDPVKFPYLIRTSSWAMKTYGTHKLYLDTDMIALKNPKFDLEKDFLVMPCNSNLMVDTKGQLISKFSKLIRHPIKKWSFGTNILSRMWEGTLKSEDYKTKRFMPHINGGSILMKNKLSKLFSQTWWNIFSALEWRVRDHRPLLYADGLAITMLTDNWGVFDLGFNYFDTINPQDHHSLPARFYDKNKIMLYHYVSDHLLQKRFYSHFKRVLKNKERKSKKTHVNIVIDSNFDDGITFINSETDENNNPVYKPLTKDYTRFEQTVIMIRSIERNWKFNYTINLIVNSSITKLQKNVLNSLNVEVYEVDPIFESGDVKLSRSLAYTLKLRKPGTHRFILDCDMIAVKDIGPQLEKLYKHDVCAMYEWDTNVTSTQARYDNCVHYLYSKFKLSPPRVPFKLAKLSHSYDRHFGNKRLPCPLYNPIMLMREASARKFGPIYERLWKELYIPEDHINSAYMIQLGMSIAMQHVAPYIGQLDAGVNMLPSLMIHPKFRNFSRVYLLHCCIDSYTFTRELSDYYLSDDPNKEFKGYEYYYNKMLKHAEGMAKEIQGADRFYEKLDIQPHYLRPL